MVVLAVTFVVPWQPRLCRRHSLLHRSRADRRRAWRWGGRGWVCAAGPRAAPSRRISSTRALVEQGCSCRQCLQHRRAASRCWCMSGRRWAPPTTRSGGPCSTATSPPSMAKARSRPVIPPWSWHRISISATIRRSRSTTRRPSSSICSARRRTMTCRGGSSPATRWKRPNGVRPPVTSPSAASTRRACVRSGRPIVRTRPTT